jgi:predicted small secreted protein
MKAWIAVFAAAAMLSLAGCNTLEGIGKDVEKAGEALQGAAKKK